MLLGNLVLEIWSRLGLGFRGRDSLYTRTLSSQARFFAAVRSPIAEPLGRVRLALAEGSNEERRLKGGSCQGPLLISILKCEIL